MLKDPVLGFVGGSKCSEEIIDSIKNAMEEMRNTEIELEEKAMAKLVEGYDFIVNGPIEKISLEKVLPSGTNVAISHYVQPGIVIIIKKAII